MTNIPTPIPTPADLAALRKRHVLQSGAHPTPWCHRCGEDWPCPTIRLMDALDAARAALRTIRDHYGQVCEEDDSCEHPACRSSYSAWATADAALRAGVAVAVDGESVPLLDQVSQSLAAIGRGEEGTPWEDIEAKAADGTRGEE